eukprot:1189471-Prorocentrum_minimum.AAC.1
MSHVTGDTVQSLRSTHGVCFHVTLKVSAHMLEFKEYAIEVLLEFKEYATEVDVDFVRKAVRAIGRCAIALEQSAEACINVLLELIQTKRARRGFAGELRGAGGDLRDQGHLPAVPEPVRDHHRHPLREPRHPRRARGQGRHDLVRVTLLSHLGCGDAPPHKQPVIAHDCAVATSHYVVSFRRLAARRHRARPSTDPIERGEREYSHCKTQSSEGRGNIPTVRPNRARGEGIFPTGIPKSARAHKQHTTPGATIVTRRYILLG